MFLYDDADRLFRIEQRDAANAPLSKSDFVYDYASRKAVSQEFTYTAGAWVQSSEKRRVFDGLDVIQERDENNQVTAQLVRDGNIAGILSRSTAVGASFFSYDGGNNVTLLTDANGDEVGRYRYDAFGNTLEISGTRAAENPYRFSTKELHGASGLYDFGYRFYSASLGRWITPDPLEEDGGINLYAMVENDPVNLSDDYGLAPRQKSYQIYYRVKLGPLKGPPYIGKASGYGSAQANINARYSGVTRQKELIGYGPNILWWSSEVKGKAKGKDKDMYAACRGLEERLINKYGGGKRKGGTSDNKNQGIDKKNPKRPTYMRKSREFWKAFNKMLTSKGGGKGGGGGYGDQGS